MLSDLHEGRVCLEEVTGVRGVPKLAHTLQSSFELALLFRRIATCELEFPSEHFPTSRYALLRAHPLTGLFRQIRRHLKHVSHHLIGDTSHGDGRHNRASASYTEGLGPLTARLRAR